MANEITMSITFAASKNGASVSGGGSKVADMAGDQMIANVQIVGTSNEVILVGDVTPTGWFFLKNMDGTNFVNVYLDSGNAELIAKLLPGEFCLVKPGAAPFAKADTAACNVQVVAVEL